MSPPDPVTYAEAARILGVTPSTVRRHVLAGRLVQVVPVRHRMLSRTDVERLALHVYNHRRHRGDETSYWVTGARAAEILGVNVSRLRVLASRGRVPSERHVDGT